MRPLTYPQLCAELNGAPPTRRQGRPVAIDPPDAAGLRIADKLPLLRQAGLVERVRGGYVLTAEGVRTARWAGIPKPDDRPERGWCAATRAGRAWRGDGFAGRFARAGGRRGRLSGITGCPSVGQGR